MKNTFEEKIKAKQKTFICSVNYISCDMLIKKKKNFEIVEMQFNYALNGYTGLDMCSLSVITEVKKKLLKYTILWQVKKTYINN